MNAAEQIIEREIALQRPEVRRNPQSVLALLTQDFTEIDSTGRTWNAEEVAAALATQSDYVQPKVVGLTAIRLAPDVQLLTYQDDAVVHSSIWTRTDPGEWRLRFHQQTRRQ